MEELKPSTESAGMTSERLAEIRRQNDNGTIAEITICELIAEVVRLQAESDKKDLLSEVAHERLAKLGIQLTSLLAACEPLIAFVEATRQSWTEHWPNVSLGAVNGFQLQAFADAVRDSRA